MALQQTATILRTLAAVGLILLTASCGPLHDLSDRIYGTGENGSSGGGRSDSVPSSDVERIPVPADGVHVVEQGNTVYGIARLYGIPVRTIIEANSLEPPYLLRLNDRLRIPSQRTYQVAKGDTVYSISRRYGVPMNELMRSNGISPPFMIVVGQTLNIPSVGDAAVETASADSPVEVSPVEQPAAAPRATPTQLAALPNPPSRSGRSFGWPVQGKVIMGFGEQPGGSNNDGINIGVPRGTKVVAAENGIVAYAGNELRGFGNLLLIKHSDGYMTAYGHNDELLVVRGQEVKKGQVISRVGSTGNVATPQLHFEIRKGRSAVDPMRYLSGRAASS